MSLPLDEMQIKILQAWQNSSFPPLHNFDWAGQPPLVCMIHATWLPEGRRSSFMPFEGGYAAMLRVKKHCLINGSN